MNAQHDLALDTHFRSRLHSLKYLWYDAMEDIRDLHVDHHRN